MNYESLQELYDMYESRGLCILAFPCNQFGKQEPNPAEEVVEDMHEKYGVTFPILEKVEVEGDDAHPLFKWI